MEAYEKAIQSAFRDVEDALVAIQTKRELVGSLERRVDALTRAPAHPSLRGRRSPRRPPHS